MSRHWGVVPSIAHTKIILHTYVIALRKVVWYHKNSFKSVLVMAWGYICIDKSSYRIVMDWWKFLVSKASKLNSGCMVCFNYTTYYLNSACRWQGTTKTTFQGGRTIFIRIQHTRVNFEPGSCLSWLSDWMMIFAKRDRLPINITSIQWDGGKEQPKPPLREAGQYY